MSGAVILNQVPERQSCFPYAQAWMPTYRYILFFLVVARRLEMYSIHKSHSDISEEFVFFCVMYSSSFSYIPRLNALRFGLALGTS